MATSLIIFCNSYSLCFSKVPNYIMNQVIIDWNWLRCSGKVFFFNSQCIFRWLSRFEIRRWSLLHVPKDALCQMQQYVQKFSCEVENIKSLQTNGQWSIDFKECHYGENNRPRTRASQLASNASDVYLTSADKARYSETKKWRNVWIFFVHVWT